MFFKLSFRNVRKSFSDYTLYFLTLTFGICIFYVFNSIEAQKAMMQISQSTMDIMKTLTWIMSGVSVFVALVLGFLIVYANNFLIRRRKREFGVYMTLGMEKSKISRILISETFIIGALSLAAGLIIGIFLSQGLSVVTAKLFEVNMTDYTFVFSLTAFWKTIAYFGIIFLIAIATSAIAISKYKLIDLINSTRRNEKQRIKNPLLTMVLFLLSLVFIGVAYWMAIKYGIASFDKKIIIEMALGAIGTFLLFASLSGALPQIIKANKKIYYKNLNMFILRQVSSRINTAHISMSFICLMLFATIGIFSTAVGMTTVLNKGYANTTPFDISITEDSQVDITKELRDNGIDLDEYTEDSHQFPLYAYGQPSLTLGTIFQSLESDFPKKDLNTIKEKVYPMPLYCIAVSDYNKLMTMENQATVNLSDHQIALMTQYAWDNVDYIGYLEKYIQQGNKLTLGDSSYTVYPKVLTNGIVNESNEILTLVVPDALIQDSPVYQSILCFNCEGDAVKAQDNFTNQLSSTKTTFSKVISKNVIQAREGGAKAVISFVGIYVGFVFLLTSAAVLALQQLSEAADNKYRYAILRKIGADNTLLSRAIWKQIAIYFFIPLLIACVHSIVGIKVTNDAIRQVGSLNATASIITAAAVILLVYGTYFVATYFGSKHIILKDKMIRE